MSYTETLKITACQSCGCSDCKFVALASSYNLDERDFDQRRTSVESSLILDLPSHLIIPAASIKLNEAIGEGMII